MCVRKYRGTALKLQRISARRFCLARESLTKYKRYSSRGVLKVAFSKINPTHDGHKMEES